jgi:uncharacterized phage infection (PIP) family protein YhgE
MSSMAKIFVVVNLLLAVVTFGSAATLLGAQDDYKTALAEVTDKAAAYKTNTDQEIDDLNAKVSQQQQKAATEFNRANGLADDLEQRNATLAGVQSKNATLNSTVETLTQELRKANEINDKSQKWLESLGAETKKATQDALNWQKQLEEERSNRGALEQQIEQLSEQTAELAAKLGDSERSLREKEFYLQQYRDRTGTDLVGGKGAKGVVNAVRGTLVSISVGSTDGVRIGDIYHIRRGGTYVGQIQIKRVEKNQAVGQFDTQFTGPGAPPQNNDVAEPSPQGN